MNMPVRPKYVTFDAPHPDDFQLRVPKFACGPMYHSHEADAYMDALEAKVAALEANPHTGYCQFCKTSIWAKQATITEGEVTLHAQCAIIKGYEARIAALEAQNAQEFNAGVEAAADDVEHSIFHGISPQYFSRHIRALKRPVVEAQKEKDV